LVNKLNNPDLSLKEKNGSIKDEYDSKCKNRLLIEIYELQSKRNCMELENTRIKLNAELFRVLTLELRMKLAYFEKFRHFSEDQRTQLEHIVQSYCYKVRSLELT